MKRKSLLAILLLLFSGILSYGQVISTYPFIEDFESQPTGPTSCGSNYAFSGNSWQNGDDPALALPLSTTHQSDWTVDAGGTGSSSTGPAADHTLGTPTGKYIYTEASGCNNLSFELISPYMDMTSVLNPQWEFWYHAYGSTMGWLYMDAMVGANGTWTTLDSLTDNQDLWQFYSTSLSSYIGVDSLRLRLRCITGTNFYSDMALDDIAIFDLTPLDAGIISIDAPANPVVAGPNNVDVTIESFGSDTLTSATIEWSANGVTQTPYSWTGNIGYLQTDPNVNIGSYNFPNGLTRVKAWTTSPNGSTDYQFSNDTTETLFCTPLVGSYTVGGAGADFADLTELGDILSTCGVGGNVNVTVNPGMYTGRMILDHVPGTSALATVTIDGIDATQVTLSNINGFSNIYLNGSSYFTIRNITLENFGTVDAYGVQLRDTAMYNTLDSLRIMLPIASGLSDVIGISASDSETSSYTEGQNALHTTVSNCYISGGEKGIHFEGQSALRTIGNRFLNNTIENVEDYAFYIDDQDSIDIIGNTITNITNANGDALYLLDLQMFNISYNSAMNVPDYGLYLFDGNYNLDGTPTSRGYIANNMISSQSDYAVYLDDFEQADIWHNTFYGNPAIRVNDIIDINFRNNIFVSDVDYAFESDDDLMLGPPMIFDYNNFWTPASNTLFVKDGAAVYPDLISWQIAQPSLNMNSTEADPVFPMGVQDLHPLSPGVNDTGDNTVGITDDIDGDTRPMGANVDMGADEFTPIADNLWLVDYIYPGTCGDSAAPIYMVVTNLGTNTVNSFNATANISGDITSTINFTFSGFLSFYQTDTIQIGTVNTYWGENFNVDGWVSLAGDADNSNDSLSGSFYVIPYEPIGYDGYACGDTSAWVFAEPVIGASYFWYGSGDQVNDTVPIAMGDSLLIPNVLTQGTYYLEYANNADSLSTPFNSNNGAGGVMFDVVALNTVTVTNFAMNMDPGTSDCAIYYRMGTWVGNDQNQNNDWILVGNSGSFTTAGTGLPTQIPLNFTVVIPAGQTYAFYIQELTSGNLVNYTNGSVVGNVLSQNADMQILEGCGKAATTPFNTSTFQPRDFNGIVYYGSTACSNIRVPVSATVGQFADPTFTALASASGNTVAFTSSGASQNTGYAWDFGDGSPIDNNANPTHTYANDGTYTFCLTATSVCGDSTICDSMDICAVMTPDFNFSISGNGYVYNFSDNTSGTPTTWNWDFGDGSPASTVQNPSHTYPANDSSYTVTLTVTNYCGDTEITTQAVSVVNVNELSLDELITISPNPSDGLFTVNYMGNAHGTTQMVIVDLQGRTVHSEEINAEEQWSKAIDLRSYENGTYFLKVVQEGASAEFQLVKTSK